MAGVVSSTNNLHLLAIPPQSSPTDTLRRDSRRDLVDSPPQRGSPRQMLSYTIEMAMPSIIKPRSRPMVFHEEASPEWPPRKLPPLL
mmetsp:Transcript_55610/g.107294  ORF Transcript_55610/g.107294 Transcript_55610/m.107294 type:complete len:87 (-) Transcript_55610:1301-1561(-)